jgi:hypothetical protein
MGPEKKYLILRKLLKCLFPLKDETDFFFKSGYNKATTIRFFFVKLNIFNQKRKSFGGSNLHPVILFKCFLNLPYLFDYKRRNF